jgi:hypothetical protein
MPHQLAVDRAGMPQMTASTPRLSRNSIAIASAASAFAHSGAERRAVRAPVRMHIGDKVLARFIERPRPGKMWAFRGGALIGERLVRRAGASTAHGRIHFA